MISKMQEILLISENNVRANTNISSNVQSKYLISTIREAQLDLEEILGSRLYNKIIKLVKYDLIDDERFVSYKSLLDRCQLYLSYNTLTKLIVVSNFHIDNFGVSQSKDDNLENVNLSDTFKLEAYYQNKVDEFTKRIQEYLLANHKEYKELCKAELDEIHSNLYSAASTSIWLGGARGKYYPWHFHCHHSHSGEHKGIIIDTKYVLQDVVYPHVVNWNATSATINYTGITVSIYDDGFIEETEIENGNIKIEFPVNISDNPIEIEGIEFWKDQEIPYSIKQLANIYVIDTTYEVVNTNYPKEIDAETTSFTVCFTGKTINHYSDGSQDSELTTYCEDVEVEENISRKDKDITGKIVKDNFEITYKVVQKGIQKQPEIIDAEYEVIDTDYPSEIPYDATSITVCYTGQTTYTWDDGSKTYEKVTNCIDVPVEPNDSEDDKEIKEDIEDDGYEIPIDVIQGGKPINCETTYQSNYPNELNYDVASFEICLTALTTCYYKDGHTDETIKHKCFTIDCGLNDTNEDRNIQGIIDEDGYEFEYNLIQHPNPKYIVNVEHIVFDIENPLEVESYITSITFNYKLKTIYHYLDGTTDEVVNSFTQTETFDANEDFDNPKMNYYRVYDEQCWTKQKPKENILLNVYYEYSGVTYPKVVEWNEFLVQIHFVGITVKQYTKEDVRELSNEVGYSSTEYNLSADDITINGFVLWNNLNIPYEYIQKANPKAVINTTYKVDNVVYPKVVNWDITNVDINYIGKTITYYKDGTTDISNQYLTQNVYIGKDVLGDERTIEGSISWNNIPIMYSILQLKKANDGDTIIYWNDSRVMTVHNWTEINGQSISSDDRPKVKGIIIGTKVQNTKYQPFAGCVNMEFAIIPNTLPKLSDGAFNKCSSLKEIYIPASIGVIDSSTFQDCTSLSSVTIENGITEIKLDAFSNCSSLKEINIPQSVVGIGTNAFENCTSLTSVTINSGSNMKIFGLVFNGDVNLKTLIFTSENAPTIYHNTFTEIGTDGVIYVPNINNYVSNRYIDAELAYLGYYNWTIKPIN